MKNNNPRIECKASNPRPSASEIEGEIDVDYVLAIDGLTQIAIPGTAKLVPIGTSGAKKIYSLELEDRTRVILKRMTKALAVNCHDSILSTCLTAVEFI